MNAKKLIALLLAAVLCLSFAACGGNDEPETTTEAPVADSTEAVDATEAPSEVESTEAASEVESTEAATEEATEEATEAVSEEETEAAAKKPEGTAAIVEYFNTAVNKVKTDAKSVKQNHVTNYLAKSPTLPSAIGGIYKILGEDKWLDGMLVDNSHGSATYTGADIDAKFPVEGESWASKLTAADVKSATCTEKDGVYTITVVAKADAKSDSVKHGQGHCPKAFNVVLPGVINDNIPGIATGIVGLSTVDYPMGKAVITVDAETGNVKTAEYDVQWTINFDKIGAAIPLGTRSSYVVTF
ncbi:MAG: hypothetical protein IKC20_04280 [Clostridia bacterium]|nr:hypothetical protein [Clostridia bacterium]MBR4049741.1 hypothetical protein [Clostridia bacterium]